MRISDWSSDVCSSDLHRFLRLCRACRSPLGSSRKDSPLNTALTPDASAADDSQARLDHLEAIAARLLERCRASGATQAEVSCSEERRSEEHTSELQSLMRISYAVFCLKKKTTQRHTLPKTMYTATH